jgi:hypothetical protein
MAGPEEEDEATSMVEATKGGGGWEGGLPGHQHLQRNVEFVRPWPRSKGMLHARMFTNRTKPGKQPLEVVSARL